MHLKANANRLDIKGNNNGGVLISRERCIRSERRTAAEHLVSSGEELLQHAMRDTDVNAD